VAHIGVELLLDAELARDTLETQHYRAVLKHAAAATRDWFPSLSNDTRSRLVSWCQRLAERAERIIPQTPEQLAERLADILQARPRLALPETALPQVGEWVAETWPLVRQVKEPWTQALQSQLRLPIARLSPGETPQP
jgi:hypothetical protein